MADSSIGVTVGSGQNVDTRTVAGGDHQQVVVLGNGVDGTVAGATSSGLPVHAGASSTASTPAQVGDTTTSTQLLALNAARKGVVIHNNSGATMWIKEGTGASSASYIYKLATQQTLSLPEPGQPIYTGVLHGIWETDAGGFAMINEKT